MGVNFPYQTKADGKLPDSSQAIIKCTDIVVDLARIIGVLNEGELNRFISIKLIDGGSRSLYSRREYRLSMDEGSKKELGVREKVPKSRQLG
jgi:hypothetical protein